jgi:predicted MPP superfamily phosphohydrolase
MTQTGTKSLTVRRRNHRSIKSEKSNHTPDYAEQVPIPNSDLVLAGHTHGGQVTLFGLYAPVVPSAYGQRFRSGLRHTTAGIPVIITNGIGTSRKSVRLFAPSEVVLIRLVALQ